MRPETSLKTLTPNLAKRFRDMGTFGNERDIHKARLLKLLQIVESNKFADPLWGLANCEEVGEVRVNGNHTSHILVACEQAHNGGFDDESIRTLKIMGMDEEDGRALLPPFPKGVSVVLEDWGKIRKSDLPEIHGRYDQRWSMRSTNEMMRIYQKTHDDVSDIPVMRLRKLMAGVIQHINANKRQQPFGLDGTIVTPKADYAGSLLAVDSIRDYILWAISLDRVDLAENKATASMLCSLYEEYGPKDAERIVEEFDKQDADDKPPGCRLGDKLRKYNDRSGGSKNVAVAGVRVVARRTFYQIAKDIGVVAS